MKILERQTELGRSLYEINTSTLRNYVRLQLDSVHKYLETNRDFGNRIAQVDHFSTLAQVQREYSEILFQNAFEAVEAQNQVLEDALNHTKDAFQAAFGGGETAAATSADKVFDASIDAVNGTADNFSDIALDPSNVVEDTSYKALEASEDTADGFDDAPDDFSDIAFDPSNVVEDAANKVLDASDDTADGFDDAADNFFVVASDATDAAGTLVEEAKSKPLYESYKRMPR